MSNCTLNFENARMLLFKVKTGGKGCAGDIKGGGLGGVAWGEGGGGEGEVLLVAILGAAMGLIIGKCLGGRWGGLEGSGAAGDSGG